MNVDYYLLAFDQATDLFFDHLGLGAAHRAANGGSTFAGDIHLTYRRELREGRSEEHTSELQSLMRISYAVFCLKKKKEENLNTTTNPDDAQGGTDDLREADAHRTEPSHG